MEIQAYIDPIGRATRIMMLRQAGWAVLMVEGITDDRFFRKYSHETCKVYPCDNKENVVNTIAVLDERKISGVLGIVDLDYEELLRIPATSDNIVRTHVHDLEVMLVDSPAIQDFLIEYADPAKLQAFERTTKQSFVTTLVDGAFNIGMVRYYCQMKSYPGDFKGLDFSGCMDSNLAVNVACAVASIFKSDTSRIASALNYIGRKSDELYGKRLHVCQGHDIVGLLRKGLSIFGAYNAKGLTVGAIQGALRLAARPDWFVRTDLYINVKQWELRGSGFKIFFDEKAMVS